jgi:hypothetical protein
LASRSIETSEDGFNSDHPGHIQSSVVCGKNRVIVVMEVETMEEATRKVCGSPLPNMFETGASTPNVGGSALVVTGTVTPRIPVDGVSDPCPIVTPLTHACAFRSFDVLIKKRN